METAPEPAAEPPSEPSSEPAQILRRIFLQRRERNPAYSSRAYARDLGISQALLSLVLNGKRPLSTRLAVRAGVLLRLSKEDSDGLIRSTISTEYRSSPKGQVDRYRNHEAEDFEVISRWYHFTILDLATTTGFDPRPAWIAQRLGISLSEAREAVELLLRLGFLVREGAAIRKADRRLRFVTRSSRAAIRAFHRQMLAKAGEALDRPSPEDFELREISGMTMAVRSDRLPEAKRRILKFEQSLAAFLSEGDCDEVFQLNIQLFPLTRRTGRSNEGVPS